MTEKSPYIAIAQVEYMDNGKRQYAEPGSLVRLTGTDSKVLLKAKAIRELNDQEKELEKLRAGSAKKAEKTEPKTDDKSSGGAKSKKADEDI